MKPIKIGQGNGGSSLMFEYTRDFVFSQKDVNWDKNKFMTVLKSAMIIVAVIPCTAEQERITSWQGFRSVFGTIYFFFIIF